MKGKRCFSLKRLIQVVLALFVCIVGVISSSNLVKANTVIYMDGIPYEFTVAENLQSYFPIGDGYYNGGFNNDYARIFISNDVLHRAETKYGIVCDNQVYEVAGTDVMLLPGLTAASLSKTRLKEAQRVSAQNAAEAKAAYDAYVARKAALGEQVSPVSATAVAIEAKRAANPQIAVIENQIAEICKTYQQALSTKNFQVSNSCLAMVQALNAQKAALMQ